MINARVYLTVIPALLLCFITTGYALEHERAGHGRQWVSTGNAGAHERIMLAGTSTALKPMLKKDSDGSSVNNLAVKSEAGKKVEKKKPVIPHIPEEMESSENIRSEQRKSHAASVKRPGMGVALLAPKLEVREFSGDFEKWSKSIVLNEPETLTFRWSTSMTKAKSARVEVREGAQLRSRKSLSSIPQPGYFQQFSLNYFSFRQAPKGIHTYTVRVFLYDDKLKQIGKPSNPVTITFKPAPMEKQKFILDTLEILSITPSGGTIHGLPSYMQGVPDEYAITINYKYELVTDNKANISQKLIDESGNIAQNNFFLIIPVDKGKGTAQGVVTVKCYSKDQPDIRVKAIKYALWSHDSGDLVMKIRDLPGIITFTCK